MSVKVLATLNRVMQLSPIECALHSLSAIQVELASSRYLFLFIYERRT